MKLKSLLHKKRSIIFFCLLISFLIFICILAPFSIVRFDKNAAPVKNNATNDNWQNAKKTWQQFAKDSLQHIQNDTSFTFVQIKNEYIDSIFPDYIVYAAVSSVRRFDYWNFFIKSNGKIVKLDSWNWADDRTNGFRVLQNIALDKLFQKSHMQITDSAKAITVVRLFESLYYGPIYLNSRECIPEKLFDEEKYARFIEEKTWWKYKARRNGYTWWVRKVYVGPPASKMMPPDYEIILSKDNKIRTVKAKYILLDNVEEEGK